MYICVIIRIDTRKPIYIYIYIYTYIYSVYCLMHHSSPAVGTVQILINIDIDIG